MGTPKPEPGKDLKQVATEKKDTIASDKQDTMEVAAEKEVVECKNVVITPEKKDIKLDAAEEKPTKSEAEKINKDKEDKKPLDQVETLVVASEPNKQEPKVQEQDKPVETQLPEKQDVK